jgi:hypothetical protein
MAMHEHGTLCLRSGGGEMVFVLLDRAAMLCMAIDTVSADKGLRCTLIHQLTNSNTNGAHDIIM